MHRVEQNHDSKDMILPCCKNRACQTSLDMHKCVHLASLPHPSQFYCTPSHSHKHNSNSLANDSQALTFRLIYIYTGCAVCVLRVAEIKSHHLLVRSTLQCVFI